MQQLLKETKPRSSWDRNDVEHGWRCLRRLIADPHPIKRQEKLTP